MLAKEQKGGVSCYLSLPVFVLTDVAYYTTSSSFYFHAANCPSELTGGVIFSAYKFYNASSWRAYTTVNLLCSARSFQMVRVDVPILPAGIQYTETGFLLSAFFDTEQNAL